MWKEFRHYGKKIMQYGLNSGKAGNMSIREKNHILITKSGVMFDEIDRKKLIKLGLHESLPINKEASVETIVHRKIYQETDHLAIIHVHSPMALVMSILTKENPIVPLDIESKCILKAIPIIEGEPGSTVLAESAKSALKDHNAFMVKSHGVFGVGKNLEEAYGYICLVEQSCKIKYFVDKKEKKI